MKTLPLRELPSADELIKDVERVISRKVEESESDLLTGGYETGEGIPFAMDYAVLVLLREIRDLLKRGGGNGIA